MDLFFLWVFFFILKRLPWNSWSVLMTNRRTDLLQQFWEKKSHKSRGRGQVALDNQMWFLCGTRLVKGLWLISGTKASWQNTSIVYYYIVLNSLAIQNRLHEITYEEWILAYENPSFKSKYVWESVLAQAKIMLRAILEI